MPESTGVVRQIAWRELLPWLILFRTFKIAISPGLLALTTVAVLQSDVQRGQETIAEQQGVIDSRTKELGTVYYTIGTKDGLKKRGIISDKGGFIGLGKTPQLTASFNEGDFTPIDTNLFNEIPLTGKKPRILSAQNKSSYDLQQVSEQKSKIMIKDPAEFRKVKYVVVMVDT